MILTFNNLYEFRVGSKSLREWIWILIHIRNSSKIWSWRRNSNHLRAVDSSTWASGGARGTSSLMDTGGCHEINVGTDSVSGDGRLTPSQSGEKAMAMVGWHVRMESGWTTVSDEQERDGFGWSWRGGRSLLAAPLSSPNHPPLPSTLAYFILSSPSPSPSRTQTANTDSEREREWAKEREREKDPHSHTILIQVEDKRNLLTLGLASELLNSLSLGLKNFRRVS